MEVDAFLADSVQAGGGKLHALGIGWRVLQTQGVPARHDRIGVGLIVRTGPAEAGEHRLQVSLHGPSGAEVPLVRGADGSPAGGLDATFATPPGDGTATLALNLDGLVFEGEGQHSLMIAVDGTERARLPFRVQTRAEAPPAEYGTGLYL
jgi:hypothetical protein